ncbi:hypothetical protein BZA05DRAFT_221497 [Tricharina praecox]|uniref:uncharacterized protein n=1 Tax=Tricharina praecox TaxID=43433 RepID=UPI002220E908|nr:uncharacterized protein BZA05DRAFT_221497 [Tricharina praecox]KAI5855933.1 hypothetical protein BZA05DRAFT_221497 [Tricharina praecox]
MFGRNDKTTCHHHHRGKHCVTGWGKLLGASLSLKGQERFRDHLRLLSSFLVRCFFLLVFSFYNSLWFNGFFLLHVYICFRVSQGLDFFLVDYCIPSSSLFVLLSLGFPCFYHPFSKVGSERGVTDVCWRSFNGIGAVLFVFLLPVWGIGGEERRGSFLYDGAGKEC